MARAVDCIHFFLANDFFSRVFPVGVVDSSEIVEGELEARFGRNLPVTNCDFVVTEGVVFGPAEEFLRHRPVRSY